MFSKLVLAAAIAAMALVTPISAKTYFKEEFGSDWKSNWVQSDWKKSEGTAGDWKLTPTEWYGDKSRDQGIQTSQDARFYATSAAFTPFSNEGKDLVVQFQVKFPQKIDCGGGYIKVLPSTVNQKEFNGESPYYLMFGPDICGTSTKKTHVILNYKGENHLVKKNIDCNTDQLSHVYTLHLTPSGEYTVYIDGAQKETGKLTEDWDLLPAKKIKDPSVSKPTDWEDNATIDDPEDSKPADWDSVPRSIPNPDSEKPEDWDDEADGEWEPDQIDNPEWKGEWKPKKIPNPNYKGKWEHPLIDNPEYHDDPTIGKYKDIGAVGIELWQVKAGTHFDNIIITDSLKEADALREQTFELMKDEEKKMFDKIETQKREQEEAERKKAEEDRKAAEEDEDEDDDDEHDEL